MRSQVAAWALCVGALALGACDAGRPLPIRESHAAPTAPVARVQRASFEDLPGMVLCDLGQGWWAAFNPRTGSVDMVWRGDVDWRGKVYDFSQGNSRASGQIAVSRLAPVATLESVRITASTPRASLGALDLSSLATAYIAFDEQGRVPVQCALVQGPAPDAALLSFESSTSYTSDTEWMWNFKQVPRAVCARATDATLAFTCRAPEKLLRHVRVYGERVAWRSADGAPLPVTWRGYTLDNGALTLRMLVGSDAVELGIAALADGRGVSLQWRGAPVGATLDGGPVPEQRLIVPRWSTP